MVRLVALSDGIYAIAMTLLVIDVAVPAGLDDSAFHQALRNALPNLGAFALSFPLTAGFWASSPGARERRRFGAQSHLWGHCSSTRSHMESPGSISVHSKTG